MTTEHLLDLSKLERDTVLLPDGETAVELRNPNELGPVDEFKFRGILSALAGYDPSEVKTEEDAQKASDDLHAFAAMIVVDCPDGLDDRSCAAIFYVWLDKHVKVPTDPQKPRKAPQDRKPKSTGARSSRGSKRSTAATRSGGSTSRSGR